jgi:hypothetical protein
VRGRPEAAQTDQVRYRTGERPKGRPQPEIARGLIVLASTSQLIFANRAKL